jgi:hypothetical protein
VSTTNPIGIAEMQEHVAGLLASMDRPDDALIVHTVKRTRQARAAREINEIWNTEVRSKITYAVVLHEIGHMRGSHQRSRDLLTRERDAWRWAKDHALVWTRVMEVRCQSSLAWYKSQIEGGKLSRFAPLTHSEIE